MTLTEEAPGLPSPAVPAAPSPVATALAVAGTVARARPDLPRRE